ncbi:MAG: cytochrome P450 [Acidothermales bacterium]|nr:cytochrome P450 [Acidothermales bacterium]
MTGAGTVGRVPFELGEEYVQDPHALYEALRADGAVRYVLLPSGLRAWLVPRYAEARALLADPRLRKGRDAIVAAFVRQYGPPTGDEDFPLTGHMLETDPPDHTRLRKLVNRAFTARRIEALRPRVREIVAGYLDELAASAPGESVDLIARYAFPIPVTVICELLGLPFADRADFRRWTAALLSVEDDADAGREMAGYLTGLVDAKRAEPADDMLSALIRAGDDEDRLSQHELVSTAFLLLVAGHETTVNLIGNGMLALLRHPDQLAALRADPGLLPGAVEELLRYDGPINLATLRSTAESVEIDGVTIPAGEFVMIALSGANRDPARFAEPDRLDVRRPAGGHVAFGHGIHYCLCAPLARMEGALAVGGLLDRFPELRLAGDASTRLRWRDSTLIRGLTELPVVPHA